MSTFYARSALKFIELSLWFLLWFREGFTMHVITLTFSFIIRWQRHRPVYSRLELHTSQTWTCRRLDMIGRLVEGDKTCRRLVCRKRKRPVEGALVEGGRRPVEGKRPVEGILAESIEFDEDSQLRLLNSKLDETGTLEGRETI